MGREIRKFLISMISSFFLFLFFYISSTVSIKNIRGRINKSSVNFALSLDVTRKIKVVK